ncbi:hypothetical protein ACWEPH_09390 [Nocardia beijingensis]
MLDRETATAQVIRSGRLTVAAPLTGTGTFAETSTISRLACNLGERTLTVETLNGDRIVAEIPVVGDVAPRHDRIAIYLDQNIWSTVYKAKYTISAVPNKEREAAEWLIDQVQQRRVLLPISIGTMTETCQWGNDPERYPLALTILQLSAGWQLRDPLAIRRHELITSMHSVTGTPTRAGHIENVTLEPFAYNSERGNTQWPASLPDGADVLLAWGAMTSLSSSFDTMLDAEVVAKRPAVGWAASNQEFTDWIVTEKHRGKELTFMRTRARFIGDSQTEIARAAQAGGFSPEDMSRWIARLTEDEIAAMPTLGLFRIVYHAKLVDERTKWVPGDLMDMMYLTAAAAYCDYLVSEKSLTSRMEQALRRLKRPVNVFRRLSDLVPVLETRLGSASR